MSTNNPDDSLHSLQNKTNLSDFFNKIQRDVFSLQHQLEYGTNQQPTSGSNRLVDEDGNIKTSDPPASEQKESKMSLPLGNLFQRAREMKISSDESTAKSRAELYKEAQSQLDSSKQSKSPPRLVSNVKARVLAGLQEETFNSEKPLLDRRAQNQSVDPPEMLHIQHLQSISSKDSRILPSMDSNSIALQSAAEYRNSDRKGPASNILVEEKSIRQSVGNSEYSPVRASVDEEPRLRDEEHEEPAAPDLPFQFKNLQDSQVTDMSTSRRYLVKENLENMAPINIGKQQNNGDLHFTSVENRTRASQQPTMSSLHEEKISSTHVFLLERQIKSLQQQNQSLEATLQSERQSAASIEMLSNREIEALRAQKTSLEKQLDTLKMNDGQTVIFKLQSQLEAANHKNATLNSELKRQQKRHEKYQRQVNKLTEQLQEQIKEKEEYAEELDKRYKRGQRLHALEVKQLKRQLKKQEAEASQPREASSRPSARHFHRKSQRSFSNLSQNTLKSHLSKRSKSRNSQSELPRASVERASKKSMTMKQRQRRSSSFDKMILPGSQKQFKKANQFYERKTSESKRSRDGTLQLTLNPKNNGESFSIKSLTAKTPQNQDTGIQFEPKGKKGMLSSTQSSISLIQPGHKRKGSRGESKNPLRTYNKNVEVLHSQGFGRHKSIQHLTRQDSMSNARRSKEKNQVNNFRPKKRLPAPNVPAPKAFLKKGAGVSGPVKKLMEKTAQSRKPKQIRGTSKAMQPSESLKTYTPLRQQRQTEQSTSRSRSGSNPPSTLHLGSRQKSTSHQGSRMISNYDEMKALQDHSPATMHSHVEEKQHDPQSLGDPLTFAHKELAVTELKDPDGFKQSFAKRPSSPPEHHSQVMIHQPSSEIFIPQALPLQDESQVLDTSASANKQQEQTQIKVFQRKTSDKKPSPQRKQLNIFSNMEKKYINFNPPKFQNAASDIVPTQSPPRRIEISKKDVLGGLSFNPSESKDSPSAESTPRDQAPQELPIAMVSQPPPVVPIEPSRSGTGRVQNQSIYQNIMKKHKVDQLKQPQIRKLDSSYDYKENSEQGTYPSIGQLVANKHQSRLEQSSSMKIAHSSTISNQSPALREEPGFGQHDDSYQFLKAEEQASRPSSQSRGGGGDILQNYLQMVGKK